MAQCGDGVLWLSTRAGTEESRLSVALEAVALLPQVLDSDEKSHYQAVMEAMRVIGFSPEEVASVRRILAAILHLVSLAVRALRPLPHVVPAWAPAQEKTGL